MAVRIPENPSRLAAAAVVGVAFVVLYLGTQRILLRPPLFPPVFGWERAIPFLPWTILVYVLAYVQVPLVFAAVRKADVRVALAGMIGLMAVHAAFFLFLPTASVRPALPEGTSAFFGSLYRLLVAIDRPRNCFPSLHVAMSVFATAAFWRVRPRSGAASLVVTTAVVASTLTLKQHYAVDLLGGLLTGSVAALIAFSGRPRPAAA